MKLKSEKMVLLKRNMAYTFHMPEHNNGTQNAHILTHSTNQSIERNQKKNARVYIFICIWQHLIYCMIITNETRDMHTMKSMHTMKYKCSSYSSIGNVQRKIESDCGKVIRILSKYEQYVHPE